MLLATRDKNEDVVEVEVSSACINCREIMAEESYFPNTGTSRSIPTNFFLFRNSKSTVRFAPSSQTFSYI